MGANSLKILESSEKQVLNDVVSAVSFSRKQLFLPAICVAFSTRAVSSHIVLALISSDLDAMPVLCFEISLFRLAAFLHTFPH